MMKYFLLALGLALPTFAAPTDGQSGCLFDGRVYAPQEEIIIAKCLGSMICLGNNNYGSLEQLGGVCPSKRKIDGQSGCLFDGRVYAPQQEIMIGNCLGSMVCLGNNNYGSLKQLGGVCPTDRNSRNVDGQSGCYFDGRVYGINEKVVIGKCLGEMTCLGNNNYSQITSLYGICNDAKREATGQTGCWYDGRVYAAGETITVASCLSRMTCLGQNLYGHVTILHGQC